MGKLSKTERNLEVVRLYTDELISSCEIARRMGISRQRVNQILQDYEISADPVYLLRRKRKKELYNDPTLIEMTNAEVAKLLKVPYWSVTKYRRRVTVADRFWDFVEKGDEDACWLWIGWTTRSGYGAVRNNGKRDYAHRVAWEKHHGYTEIPNGLFVMHKCGNKACCNPEHLYLSDNKRDTWTGWA